jgi:hypothetical protein
MSKASIGLGLLLLFLSLSAPRPARAATADPGAAAEGETAEREDSRQQDLYEEGTDALDESQWEHAAALFAEAARQPGDRADGALYWQAYAQSKLGRKAEALATLGELSKRFPKSRWVNDAAALELELKGSRNVSPDSVEDEELKLIALNSLMSTDSERAIPMLEKFLGGTSSPKLKDRALFVLAQNGSPQARQIVADIARGKRNPGLQEKAIKYLGLFGGESSRGVLNEIYGSTASRDVKEEILRSYMVSGDREHVLAAARGEKDPALRESAVHQLGVMGARTELWQLYHSESSDGVKGAIIQALFVGGDADHLLELARTEKNKELRMEAIHKAGLTGKAHTGDALADLYRSEKDPEIRGAVLQAFFLQGNSRGLIAIAKSEKDPELKQEAVRKLSLMTDKEARDYLLEILSK